jgi:hypothetical protein
MYAGLPQSLALPSMNCHILDNSMVSFYLSNSNNNRRDDIFMSDHIEKMQFEIELRNYSK